MLTSTDFPNFPNAECYSPDIDPDIFFADGKREMEDAQVALSKICGRCIHKADCLDFAVTNGIREGYWGGTTPSQRSHLLKTVEEKGSERFREIQGYFNLGMNKWEVAKAMGIRVESLDRTLARAKEKGIL